jgi:NADH dehydrogenase
MAAAAAAGVTRVVLLSGLGTRAAPERTYMSTRWGMEEAVRNSGIPHAIVQPSVMFGDNAPFVAALARLVRLSPAVPALTGPYDKFQPIWVEDVVTCISRALVDDAHLGRAVAIGGPDHLKFRQIVRTICDAMGKRRLLIPLPVGLARIPAAVMSVLPSPPITPAALELFSFENATDLDAVKKHFGFAPRPFRQHLLVHGIAG